MFKVVRDIFDKLQVFYAIFLIKGTLSVYPEQGRNQDCKLGEAHLKKLGRTKGGAKIFRVFRVKNHDFTPKNHIFSNFRGARLPSEYISDAVRYSVNTTKLYPSQGRQLFLYI